MKCFTIKFKINKNCKNTMNSKNSYLTQWVNLKINKNSNNNINKMSLLGNKYKKTILNSYPDNKLITQMERINNNRK